MLFSTGSEVYVRLNTEHNISILQKLLSSHAKKLLILSHSTACSLITVSDVLLSEHTVLYKKPTSRCSNTRKTSNMTEWNISMKDRNMYTSTTRSVLNSRQPLHQWSIIHPVSAYFVKVLWHKHNYSLELNRLPTNVTFVTKSIRKILKQTTVKTKLWVTTASTMFWTTDITKASCKACTMCMTRAAFNLTL